MESSTIIQATLDRYFSDRSIKFEISSLQRALVIPIHEDCELVSIMDDLRCENLGSTDDWLSAYSFKRCTYFKNSGMEN